MPRISRFSSCTNNSNSFNLFTMLRALKYAHFNIPLFNPLIGWVLVPKISVLLVKSLLSISSSPLLLKEGPVPSLKSS